LVHHIIKPVAGLAMVSRCNWVMRGGKNPLEVELTSSMALPFGASPVAFIPTLWAFTPKAKTISRQADRIIFIKFFIVALFLRFKSFLKVSPFIER
jgi:hypothetical protein